ncbi:MAG: TMEM175 family protein [Solirubrobacterales bacterium]
MSEEKRARSYDRDSIEFGRALTFSDGLFAIAMTLLVVSISVPTLAHGGDVSELADALNDRSAEFISFFISFAVIGRYWLAHHQFFSLLARMDQGLISLNLIYLAFVAFLPFPTALLGEQFENPLSIAIYATNVAVVSGMEVVLFRHAYRRSLFARPISAALYKWGALNSFFPVVFFLLSIPVGFLSTTLAVGVWLLMMPAGALSNRWKPEGADELLLS